MYLIDMTSSRSVIWSVVQNSAHHFKSMFIVFYIPKDRKILDLPTCALRFPQRRCADGTSTRKLSDHYVTTSVQCQTAQTLYLDSSNLKAPFQLQVFFCAVQCIELPSTVTAFAVIVQVHSHMPRAGRKWCENMWEREHKNTRQTHI